MNLNQLKYYVAVAENHSFTKAAEQYFITQTAITQQMRALEEVLECQLFDRGRRPIALTPAGETFLLEAKAIIERTEGAVTRTRNAAAGIVGNLNIGYIKGYERSPLSDRMREFHRQYPNIVLRTYRSATDELAAGLANGFYDIIYTWDSTNLKADDRMQVRFIENAPLVVALFPSHPFAQRKHLTRKDLKDETILYMSPSEEVQSMGDAHFMEMYRQAGYQPKIQFRSTDAESIMMMVASEQGISVLPDYFTKKLDHADNLVFLPLEGVEECEEITAIWKKDNTNPALQQFLEMEK